jgi:hypothetical protein
MLFTHLILYGQLVGNRLTLYFGFLQCRGEIHRVIWIGGNYCVSTSLFLFVLVGDQILACSNVFPGCVPAHVLSPIGSVSYTVMSVYLYDMM